MQRGSVRLCVRRRPDRTPTADAVRNRRWGDPRPFIPGDTHATGFLAQDKLLIMLSKITQPKEQRGLHTSPSSRTALPLGRTTRFMQVVTGARQLGKTTLVTQVVEKVRLPYVFASADEPTRRGLDWIDAQWEAARLLRRGLHAPRTRDSQAAKTRPAAPQASPAAAPTGPDPGTAARAAARR